MIQTLLVLLAASVLFVPISRRFGFGSVLGYLVAGVLIGPFALGLVRDVKQIAEVSELGVLMLLFLIGLELRPKRIWLMRKPVLGLGSAQVIVTGALLAVLAHAVGASWPAASILGVGLALSSTAIALPMMAERDLLGLASGRESFAVLLFQDLASIPLVALAPFMTHGGAAQAMPWLSIAKAAAGVAVILIGGRLLMRPLFRLVGGARTPEVFTATALMLVVGAAAITELVGLPMSLGAFAAGVLLSDSEYRHELRADVEPFEGLLLGFFFISVGMGANVHLAWAQPLLIFGGVILLVLVKALILYGLALARRQKAMTALRFALALPQGSEFAFVLFAAAVAVGALPGPLAERATLIIALSMLISPLLFSLSERFIIPRMTKPKTKPYDQIESQDAPVIIAGLGRMGQIVARILRMQGIAFTALENDSEQVETVRRYGSKVFFGDPSRPEVLRAAGADQARLLVLTTADVKESLAIAETVTRNFPHLKIVARARNRFHAHQLMDMAVLDVTRETYHSSLRMAEATLKALGHPPDRARREVGLFRDYDEQLLTQQRAFRDDEGQMIQSTRNAAEELASLLEADRARAQATQPAKGPVPASR
ncbi:MAG: monovalent cation:proton antiporter-2 (CPA2) family protein [Caulobacteraceae bacterium]|nr:monovalent cation:proton antiporter-2 (CPA2) family protein [Caulobacteraceae bacterium]